MRTVASVAVAWLALGTAPASAGASGQRVPFTDHSVVGSIGLCTRSGHEAASGSVNARPFAWRAVSSAPAPDGYGGIGRTATLFAYQPRQGLTPDEWSGSQLTASSRYSNPAHPMAAATRADDSLAQFLEEYPAQWDGMVELRLYLAAPEQEAESQHYPALDIVVTGSKWHAVGERAVHCSSGTAESLETAVRPTASQPATSSHTSPLLDAGAAGRVGRT